MRSALFALALLAAAPAAAQEAAESEVPDPPSVELRPAQVRFRSDFTGLRVHYMQDPVLDEAGDRLVVRRGPPSRYVELCEAPCDVDLPQTHLGLAVQRGGHLVRFEQPLGVDGPTGVRLTWEDRGSVRIAGILTMVFGAAIGVSVAGLTLGLSTDDAATVGGTVASGVVLAAGVTIGVLLVLTEDSARFETAPLPGDTEGLFSSEWN